MRVNPAIFQEPVPGPVVPPIPLSEVEVLKAQIVELTHERGQLREELGKVRSDMWWEEQARRGGTM